ncbi:MAG: cytochrome c [Pseudomonadota bacterium]
MRARWLIIIVVFVLIGAGGWLAYDRFFARDIQTFADDVENFNYGSIGNDGATGIPYPIWRVLPKICSHHLPGPDGYASLGFAWEPGRDQSATPIGFSRVRVGVERMAINCAFCHTVRARIDADADPEIYVAGAGNTIDVLGYQRFLTNCAADETFAAGPILAAMQSTGIEPSFLDRLLYRFLFIPFTRDALLEQGQDFTWVDSRPEWGPGRIDPFNPVKFVMLGLEDDDTIGNSDMQPIWNLDAREAIRRGAPLHWDGLNTSIREVVISSALGDGAVADEFDFAAMDRIERFLRALPAPPSPHAPNTGAANRGQILFSEYCAECHSSNGERTLTVIPINEIGTDPHRLAMWTDEARDAYNAYDEGYDWGFSHFQNVEGYIAEPLDGLWLNGPFLHNGSVPTLADLLMAPEERPATFLRGLDILDSEHGGFLAPPCDPQNPPAKGFCYDTSLPGNSNDGHSWGTDLDVDQKADLLAYLMTF